MLKRKKCRPKRPSLAQFEFLEIRQLLSATLTTTRLVPSPLTAVFDQSVTLTATVTARGASPATGIVTFEDGGNVLGTAALNSQTHVASLSTSDLTVGSHSLTALYGASNGFSASTSAVVKETVKADPTKTVLASSATTASFGVPITLTATVTSTSGAPSGIVTFKDGLTVMGTATVDTGTNTAVLVLSDVAIGSQSITAVYGGTNVYATSTSAAVKETINIDPSTTTLSGAGGSVVVGQTVTLNANVSSTIGQPTGTVTFKDGAVILASGPVNTLTGEISFSASDLAVGTHHFTAAYTGKGYASSTSASATEVVTPERTTTTLTASTTSPFLAESVTLTATVGAVDATGTVTFKDGSKILATEALNITTDTAVFSTSKLALGTHDLVAIYSGAKDFQASTSATVVETVFAVETDVSLQALPSPGFTGQSVTLTASVSAVSGSPGGGVVTFLDGTTTLGMASVNVHTDLATFTTSSLTLGTHNLTASYGGITGFAPSTSAALSETINLNPTTTTLTVTSPDSPVLVGDMVTLTAVVVSTGSATGNITFEDGSTTLAVVAVNNGTASFTTSALAVGTHGLIVVYSGDSKFATSTSTTSVEDIQTTTTTSLALSASSVTLGQNVTLTAMVTGSHPTGDVTFTYAGTTLGTAEVNSSGTATFVEYNLFAGTYAFAAAYTGDLSHQASNSGTNTLTITQPTYSTTGDGLGIYTATAGSGSAAQNGATVSVEYTLYPNGVFNQTSIGSTPFQFTLGSGTIQGFAEGVAGMLPGETRVLDIPPSLGYGANPPSGSNIPVNATLVFIVQMLYASSPPNLLVTDAVNSTEIVNNQAPSAFTGTDFGSVPVGDSSPASTFLTSSVSGSITFTGSPVVEISGTDPGDFNVASTPLNDGSGDYQFTITFTPTATGTRTATITIPTDDSNVPDFTFTVTGVGA